MVNASSILGNDYRHRCSEEIGHSHPDGTVKSNIAHAKNKGVYSKRPK
jgi:hypothetical protein